jgi:hypothetical protein
MPMSPATMIIRNPLPMVGTACAGAATVTAAGASNTAETFPAASLAQG